MSRHHKSRRSFTGSINRSSSRKIVSTIFSFFLAFFLALAVAGVAVMSHVLFSGLLSSLFNDSYCEGVKTRIEEDALYYTLPSGFPPEVLDNVFKIEEIKGDIKSSVEAAYKNRQFEPSTTLLQDRIVDNVTAYINSAGQQVDENVSQAINGYAADIIELYKKDVQVPGMAAFGSMRGSIMLYGGIAIVALLLLSFALIVSIKRIHHFMHRVQRYWGYAAGGAALMCIAAPLLILILRPHRGLNFTPEYFYNFGVGLIDKILVAIIVGGIVLLAAAVILFVLSARGRNDLVSRSSRHFHNEHTSTNDFGLSME